MKKIFVLSVLLCFVSMGRAQYIGSQYLNFGIGCIIDESQILGSFGIGKVYKNFKVGAILNYRNMNQKQVKANTVTVGPEVNYYLLNGSKFSLSGILNGTIGFQKADTKTELIRIEKSKAFVYGYEVGIRPELLLTPTFALTAEYRFSMLFNSVVRNNNYIGIGCIVYM